MGYTTDFQGFITVEPPLNEAEIAYLHKFNSTRRMDRENGPYFVDGEGEFGQGDGPDVIRNFNYPPEGQPGLWCQWAPTEDGTAIGWDEGEKFYEAEEWMIYLIDHFLRPGAKGAGHPLLEGFTFDHVCNGVIYAQGEESDDTWRIVVKDNVVSTQSPTVTWPDV